MKTLVLTILAGVFASTAVIVNDTPHRFQTGQKNKGRVEITETFIGETWRCGSETCFAGISIADSNDIYFHTGP